MSASQRVSRGFHRLGVLLAMILALIGLSFLLLGGFVKWETPIPYVSAMKWTMTPPSLSDFRQRYPEYDDMPDDKLLDALYRKFYADIPREQFDARVRTIEGKRSPHPPAGFVPDEELQIAGIGKVSVSGKFSELSPAEQNETVKEIASAIWWEKFATPLFAIVGITLAASLGVYGVVRAIGWVIGGFAAS